MVEAEKRITNIPKRAIAECFTFKDESFPERAEVGLISECTHAFTIWEVYMCWKNHFERDKWQSIYIYIYTISQALIQTDTSKHRATNTDWIMTRCKYSARMFNPTKAMQRKTRTDQQKWAQHVSNAIWPCNPSQRIIKCYTKL